MKWTQSGSSSRSGHNRGAVEIGEEQLKWKQSGSSSSAQRAVQRRITHVGERGEVAERAKQLVIIMQVMKSYPKYVQHATKTGEGPRNKVILKHNIQTFPGCLSRGKGKV